MRRNSELNYARPPPLQQRHAPHDCHAEFATVTAFANCSHVGHADRENSIEFLS